MIAGVLTLPARVRPLDAKALDFDRTIAHEARHAVLGELFQFKISEARADYPTDFLNGRVLFDTGDEEWTPLRAAEMAMVILAGPAFDGKSWPPTWPLDHHGCRDERQLAGIAAELELSERQWDGLVDITRWLVQHPVLQAAEKNRPRSWSTRTSPAGW